MMNDTRILKNQNQISEFEQKVIGGPGDDRAILSQVSAESTPGFDPGYRFS